MHIETLSGLALTLVRFLAAGFLGSLLTAVAVFIYILDSRTELSVWHTADLAEEFTARSGLADFAQYRALEDRLFSQLDELVYARVPTGPPEATNRYSLGPKTDLGNSLIRYRR